MVLYFQLENISAEQIIAIINQIQDLKFYCNEILLKREQMFESI